MHISTPAKLTYIVENRAFSPERLDGTIGRKPVSLKLAVNPNVDSRCHLSSHELWTRMTDETR